ncbi:MAG TPA: hypothetical protein ENI15_20180 [Spirochaetes bacterium]|nr:hypothetical protein [Spirochaetota bacterium]
MTSAREKLNMIHDNFNKGLEVLGIIKEQLLSIQKASVEPDSVMPYQVWNISEVDNKGIMTFDFAGIAFFVKIKIKFRSERGFNQYEGLIGWGIYNDQQNKKEEVKVTNEYKWTARRIFIVETAEDDSTSHIIVDEGKTCDCSSVISNNIYNCLPDSLKAIEIRDIEF